LVARANAQSAANLMRHCDLSLARNSCQFLHSQSSFPYSITLLLTCGNAKSSVSKQVISRCVSTPTSKVLADLRFVYHVDQLRAVASLFREQAILRFGLRSSRAKPQQPGKSPACN